MDQQNLEEKKKVGSVAVDAETGMEHYGVPKADGPTAPPTPQASDQQPETISPNYGKEAPGETQDTAGVPDEFMKLFEHDASEVILMQAVRHPIGVVAIFAVAGLAVLLIVITYLFLVSDNAFLGSLGVDRASVGAIGALISLILLVLVTVPALVAAHVYKKSRLILTNQKVVLIQYHSLISREVSQLNIGEVEDVNVSQPSLVDRIFKTGKVTIETAGEQNNYVLTQVERPYDFARKTIQMHEGSIAEYGN